MEIDASLWKASNTSQYVWTAQLPSNTQYFKQLFVNGERATLARTGMLVRCTARLLTCFV